MHRMLKIPPGKGWWGLQRSWRANWSRWRGLIHVSRQWFAKSEFEDLRNTFGTEAGREDFRGHCPWHGALFEHRQFGFLAPTTVILLLTQVAPNASIKMRSRLTLAQPSRRCDENLPTKTEIARCERNMTRLPQRSSGRRPMRSMVHKELITPAS